MSTTTGTTTATPDLLGMQVAHRGMISDSRRFTQILADVENGAPCSVRRARAIGDYLADFADSIHHHHTVEDDVLWPLIRTEAGAAVDLRELEDDHAGLDPLLDALREQSTAFVASADVDVRRGAAPLRNTLDTLHRVLSEHIADEEHAVFPIITGYLSCAQWKSVEDSAKKGGKLGFEFPRFLAHTTEAEQQRVLADGGIGLRILVRVVLATAGRSYRRREAVIAGP
ncbi:hemerythrin domain-containing protein [Williamsia sterculiae]|uniref:Hemerythrin HHE cation binding domain-containing protein n=1 Tax=Williamsia sterculiae TaxID=1344003 RepID=A0A1N7GXV1_9NOCA|nr:hemerythrin domain-containing protein [Williamsia sterculiae]SIS17411.1 Hemerythrin HHE cation binding domain-containing protein [Williamsia sterculiae]